MPEVNEKVMTMVREEIDKNPNVTTQELFEKAKKLDKSVAGLSARQFNARYPLQIKRQRAPRGRARRGRSRRAANRDAVRAVLLQFARDVAAAEGKADMISIVEGVDTYVDQVVKAAGRS